MGMVLKFNPRQLEANIAQVGERAMKGMSDKMRKTAIRIRDLARSYAPVKSGLLESSIDYITLRKDGRNTFAVFIDLDAGRYAREGQLGDYAFIMEEQLRPFGMSKGKRYYVSPKSAAKGPRVGGRFMSRAVKEGTKDLPAALAAIVRRITGGGRSANVSYERSGGDDE